jgi:hypothetical protein
MPAAELRRKCAACLSDVVAIPDRRVVRDGERLVVVLHPDHRGDRPEDLLAVDAHGRVRLREKRGLQVKPVGCALQALAAECEPGALLLPDVEVHQVLLELLLVDHRADVGPVL